ncbi:hypothetical protein THAOC_16338 [Thalassiosira oceanica]|uniref:MYND-type domain-containing protein n=1 Tax=Thalassiosira oceanica TaxID=159749 RepID=K0SXP2_THAOC|nr:hypothetical protein THAOC_16338 [Thalassiosira oceanica]|eukprot:EJK63032.1 hypothetical protein THAOC_16338 [Thalassiosira oceanica]
MTANLRRPDSQICLAALSAGDRGFELLPVSSAAVRPFEGRTGRYRDDSARPTANHLPPQLSAPGSPPRGPTGPASGPGWSGGDGGGTGASDLELGDEPLVGVQIQPTVLVAKALARLPQGHRGVPGGQRQPQHPPVLDRCSPWPSVSLARPACPTHPASEERRRSKLGTSLRRDRGESQWPVDGGTNTPPAARRHHKPRLPTSQPTGGAAYSGTPGSVADRPEASTLPGPQSGGGPTASSPLDGRASLGEVTEACHQPRRRPSLAVSEHPLPEEGHPHHLQSPMSCVPIGEPVVDDGNEVCANCGKQGSDTVKLKSCTACRLVKYCSVDCQKAHRKLHKKACKQRAAELKDEQLYSQGHERPEGDFCSICTLPIPMPMGKHSGFNVCCMKRICDGCDIAAQKRGMLGCAFCRTRYPGNDADVLAMIQARVAKKDPDAINRLGQRYFHGDLGLQKDMRKGVEMYTEAAELGSIEAFCNLGLAHVTGRGVEQDEAKGIHFWEKAAMRGDVESRHNLGCNEMKKNNHGRAVRHWLISAKMGYEASLESIKEMFMAGHTTKEQYAEALKGYQDAVEGTKSHDRDEANRFFALWDARKQWPTRSE